MAANGESRDTKRRSSRQTGSLRHAQQSQQTDKRHTPLGPDETQQHCAQTDYTRELQANGNGEWATTKHTYAQTDLTIRVNHLQGQCSNQIERATNERDDDDAQRTRGPNTDRVND